MPLRQIIIIGIQCVTVLSHSVRFSVQDIIERKSIEEEVTFQLYYFADDLRHQFVNINNISGLSNSQFNKTLPSKFIIHGWTHGQEAHWIQEMREVMARTKKWNTIVVDWAPMSYSIYSHAREHARLVGQQLGEMCIFLAKTGYIDVADTHFIGHSMGAHIAGYAADIIKNNINKTIGRITGLDPSALMFERPYLEIPSERLDSTDGHFVDVIHTNGRGLGMMTAIGHVDYYANGGIKQPGCGSWICSHERSCDFWTASINHPCAYRAVSYASWDDYLTGKSKIAKVFMGMRAGSAIPRGLYFLETSHKAPFVHKNANFPDFIK